MKKEVHLIIQQVVHFQRGFIEKLSLNNGSGRHSMWGLLEMIKTQLPFNQYQLVNLSGSAPNWWGNCKIGKIYDLQLSQLLIQGKIDQFQNLHWKTILVFGDSIPKILLEGACPEHSECLTGA